MDICIDDLTEEERQRYFTEKLRDIVAKRSADLGRPLTACVQTFGCQMNAKDSEKLIGILTEAGYLISTDEASDFVLYNTCTVRDSANQRVYGRLGYLHSLKNKNNDMIIALCGCMMQEKGVTDRIKSRYAFVDIVFGTYNISRLAELLYRRYTEEHMIIDVWSKPDKIVEDLPSERKYSFKCGVNIMYGCNNFCSYCIVPYVRGRERSRRPGDIIAEIEALAEDGVVEVMLLGQNVNSYGKTFEDGITFAQLLNRVSKISGIERIRFMTSHPKDLSDELIEVMAENPKVCPHLHLPLQSGSSRILKLMHRSYNKERYLELVDRLRAAVPDIALTTDIIVGFPGETEDDFEETMDVVRRVGFDNAFTFIYSKRAGTPAASMPDQIGRDVVQERFDRLLSQVQKDSEAALTKHLGRTMYALTEGPDTHSEGYMSGRLGNNTMVSYPGTPDETGHIVPVKLTTAKRFYYIGERV